MSDVDEIVGVMVNASCKIVNGSVDLLLQALRALTNRQKVVTENDKNTLSDRAKEALTRKVRGFGSTGEVSLAALNKATGGEIAEVSVARDDLVALKQELMKRGVAFHVLKSDDDTVDILFSAKSYALMESSIAAVARKMGATETQIEEALRPEIKTLGPSATETEIAENERAIEQFVGSKTMGLDWVQAPNQESLAFTSQNGPYDIFANADGSWRVTVMGAEHARGWAGEGVYSAAVAAVNASKALENRASLTQGVELGKKPGVSSPKQEKSTNRASSVEELAQHAQEKAKTHNAKLPTEMLGKDEPKVSR